MRCVPVEWARGATIKNGAQVLTSAPLFANPRQTCFATVFREPFTPPYDGWLNDQCN
jgi:hypothetical protein